MQVNESYYTVIYTSNNQWGTLVHDLHVRIPNGKKLSEVLEKKNICMTQVVRVFPGWQTSIISDWSEIKGE